MNDSTLQLLQGLDAAPLSTVSTAEAERREAMLARILTSAAPGAEARAPRAARPRRRRLRGWAGFGVGTVLVGAAAFGTLVAAPHFAERLGGAGTSVAQGPLTTTELSSWTNVPSALPVGSALAAKAAAWCTTNLGSANGAGGSPTITSVDARGSVASLVYERAGNLYYCVSAGDGTGLWEVIDQAPATASLPAGGITLDTAGSHGDGAAGLTYAVGYANADVTGVTLHEPGVGAISATLQGGRWTAWWPTPGDTAHGEPVGTITITTTGGATRTVSAASIETGN